MYFSLALYQATIGGRLLQEVGVNVDLECPWHEPPSTHAQQYILGQEAEVELQLNQVLSSQLAR